MAIPGVGAVPDPQNDKMLTAKMSEQVESSIFDYTDEYKKNSSQTVVRKNEQNILSDKQKLLKTLNINENRLFDNPKNTEIESGKGWILRTESYPNGKEKTRFYYKKISDNRATVAILKRGNDGTILFENNATINDFGQANCFINNPKELIENISASDRFFDNPKNTQIERGKGWILRTESYPNGNEKTRFYYKKISDNRVVMNILRRGDDGTILFENEVTINDLSKIPNL